MKKVYLFVLTVLLSTAAYAAPENDADALWQALAGGGHVALMRHALAPGTGDPVEFALDDCTTQRNLNDAGRAQARRAGAALRERGVEIGAVFSSQWCRCLETASLLNLGEVTPLAALNSFYQRWQNETAQTDALREFLASLDSRGPSVLMVTHQVNISALSGGAVASGEIAVFKLGDFVSFVGMLTPY